jgi:uncharacterized protein YidB (DUF937 family)
MGLFDQGFSSSKGLSPAAMALLGMLAVKGFQNRDKLGEMLGGLLGGGQGGGGPAGDSAGGALGGLLGGLFGGGQSGAGQAGAGHVVSGGLGDLLDSFRKAGHGDVADSWVQDGPERAPAPHQIEQSLGTDVLDQLATAAGISRAELLQKLQQVLPQAVDALTPDSRVPSAQEAESVLGTRRA